jgi:hypothetical protein
VSNLAPQVPPHGSLVTWKGYYWRYDDFERTWEAHSGYDPESPVVGRTQMDSTRGRKLLLLWQTKGEPPEVRIRKALTAQADEVRRIGFFRPVEFADPPPKLCLCTVCGSYVDPDYAARHRRRCRP